MNKQDKLVCEMGMVDRFMHWLSKPRHNRDKISQKRLQGEHKEVKE